MQCSGLREIRERYGVSAGNLCGEDTVVWGKDWGVRGEIQEDARWDVEGEKIADEVRTEDRYSLEDIQDFFH